MFGSKRFGIWCVAAMVVALFVGMLAGTASVSAQEPQFTEPPVIYIYIPPDIEEPPVEGPQEYIPPSIEEPVVYGPEEYEPPCIEEPMVEGPVTYVPPVVVTPPPRPTDFQLYQQYLARLLQLNAEMATLTARIGIYQAVSLADPEDPFIQYELQMMWFQLHMMQMEQTEVRFVLTTLNP